MESKMDERGRVTILREYRGQLGPRFVQILTPHGLLLRPVPSTLRAPPGLRALDASGERDASAQAGA